MRESLTLLLEAIIKADARAVTEAYLELAPASDAVNRAALHLLGEFMVTSGFVGMLIIGIGALRGGRDQR
ncbi:MAG: hypothetical protein HGA45_16315 [Chloroflexales bacterium]|nr:hypothetical protein [Chloroflexales bacterium]